MQPEQIRLLVESVKRGSISAGGRVLGLSPAAASAALKRLENQLGVRLLERSTRTLSLTSAGEQYLAMVEPALELMDEAAQKIRDDQQQLGGEIRISAPSDLGRSLLANWLNRFQQEYPQMRVYLSISDRRVDLVHEGFDLAIRYGMLADSTLIARPLLYNLRVLCASPEYLQRHGTPQKPEDLVGHNCLSLSYEGGFNGDWKLQHPQQGPISINVQGDRYSDDGSMIKIWAIQGAGIASKSWVDIASEVQAGNLQRVLPGWYTAEVPIHLVYPQRRFQPQRIRLLIDFLVQRFECLPKIPGCNWSSQPDAGSGK